MHVTSPWVIHITRSCAEAKKNTYGIIACIKRSKFIPPKRYSCIQSMWSGDNMNRKYSLTLFNFFSLTQGYNFGISLPTMPLRLPLSWPRWCIETDFRCCSLYRAERKWTWRCCSKWIRGGMYTRSTLYYKYEYKL